MALRQVSLDDKYEGRDGKVYITGTQSLVRAAIMQHLRDEADSLKTGCFISGYRGSPMHNLDKELWAGKRFLPRIDIHFLPATPEEIVAHRSHELTAYQDAAYAEKYKTLVETVRRAETNNAPGMSGLAETVARHAYKLMAYKDEFEVARLYTDGRFEHQIRNAFQGEYFLRFHLAPPILTNLNPEIGLRDKQTCGPWIFGEMRLLARLKWLRGTPFNFCGWSGERRMQRKLAADYIKHMTEVAQGLSHDNHALAVKLAGVPDRIRGYGHVKERYLLQAEADRNALLDTWRRPSNAAPAAA